MKCAESTDTSERLESTRREVREPHYKYTKTVEFFKKKTFFFFFTELILKISVKKRELGSFWSV